MRGEISRIRTNIKESSKGTVQREVTVEFNSGDIINISDPKDAAKVEEKHIAVMLWDLYEDIGNEGVARNYNMAGGIKA